MYNMDQIGNTCVDLLLNASKEMIFEGFLLGLRPTRRKAHNLLTFLTLYDKELTSMMKSCFSDLRCSV